jgi:bifunctional DNA-binding transcriptional regulator/antitoxin component of YhaV-PrlF toxin-antitoxin module
MKIQKQLSKKRGDKIYYKYVVVIPDEILEESGLKAGDELVAEAGKGEVKLKKNG